MRVLFVSPREAWPAKSGARLRDFHLASALARDAELTYIYFADTPAQSELPSKLVQAKRVLPVASPRKYTPDKILKGILGSQPLPVQNYTSRDMSEAIESALRSEPFDIVHLDSIHLAGYLHTIQKWAPAARVILNWHNIESELMTRYSTQPSSLVRRLYARATVRSLRRLESRMLRACFGHIVCSEREKQELLSRAPGARIAVALNGVDTTRFQAVQNSPANARNGLAPGQTEPPGRLGGFEEPDRLIFVGQMSYHANVEAVRWFARDIWPAVRERHPGVTLHIVGSDPPPGVLALRSQTGIFVTGTVPDVLPFYERAIAAIVPLRTGGGTRLKILEAMAAGVPVISTAIGAEGLHVTDGRDILIAGEGVGSWLAAICITRGTGRDQLIAQGRELVFCRYDWDQIGRSLTQVYQSWCR